jgi:hypothetical protein
MFNLNLSGFYTRVTWLVLSVSLTGLKDAQTAGKTLFLGVSMRVFPGKRFAFECLA